MELYSIICILSLMVMVDLHLLRNRGLSLELKCSALETFCSTLIACVANQASNMWMLSSWVELEPLGMNSLTKNSSQEWN